MRHRLLPLLLTLAVMAGVSPPTAGSPDPDSREERVLALVARAVLTAARPGEGTARAAARWEWPVGGPREVLRPFDPPNRPWLPGHRGVDLAGTEAGEVRAVADGVVTYSGAIAGTGIVSVTHPDGIRSTYQPVEDRLPRGSRVASGERVGALGAPDGAHCPTGCLHLGAVRGQTYLDPMLFLRPLLLALLPEDG